jgi:hypothetical protein
MAELGELAVAVLDDVVEDLVADEIIDTEVEANIKNLDIESQIQNTIDNGGEEGEALSDAYDSLATTNEQTANQWANDMAEEGYADINRGPIDEEGGLPDENDPADNDPQDMENTFNEDDSPEVAQQKTNYWFNRWWSSCNDSIACSWLRKIVAFLVFGILLVFFNTIAVGGCSIWRFFFNSECRFSWSCAKQSCENSLNGSICDFIKQLRVFISKHKKQSYIAAASMGALLGFAIKGLSPLSILIGSGVGIGFIFGILGIAGYLLMNGVCSLATFTELLSKLF